MIKICHESPKALFKESRKYNDYDYYLDYLWDDKEYINFFKESLRNGRTVIMDSSLFEFHPIVPPIDKFFEHVNELGKSGNNIEYIITDVLNNKDATIEKVYEWEKYFKKNAVGKSIGVCQGSTLEELTDCYKFMIEHVDKVAIPFDSAAFESIVSDEETTDILEKWTLGRQRFVRHLVDTGVWKDSTPCHLLGCSYVWEFSEPLYQKVNIESLDTSSPIIYALEYLKYENNGNTQKPKKKLVDLINYIPDIEQYKLAAYNVTKFREIVNG